MIIELLDSNRDIIKLKSISEIPKDISQLCSVQIVDFTKQDISDIEKHFDIDTTILNHSDDIEISSHYLEKGGQLAFNFSFPYFSAQHKIEEVIISFILKEKIMFTFMAINFERFIPDNKKQEHFDNLKSSPFTLEAFLMMMIGIIPDYFADLTEVIAKNVKATYLNLQKQKDFSVQELNEITALKFDNYLVKESLNEFRRILHLLRKSKKLTSELKESISSELNDLTVVFEYIQNNSERLDDLKEYVSNKIELEQNRIFKILTVITTCFALPMLIAGIFGMNFKYMPFLEWCYGYFFIIGLSFLGFITPLIWFKWKKWLR